MLEQDTVQDGQFLNKLKHDIHAITIQLDGTGTKVFQNNSREAHEIRHAVTLLMSELATHGISMEESLSPRPSVNEKIQQAIELIRTEWARIKGETNIPDYKKETLHPYLALQIFGHSIHVTTAWTLTDILLLHDAWDQVGRK